MHPFPSGEDGALLFIIYSFEYICLFIILPGYRFCRFFSAFYFTFVAYLVPLCRLYVPEVLLSGFDCTYVAVGV